MKDCHGLPVRRAEVAGLIPSSLSSSSPQYSQALHEGGVAGVVEGLAQTGRRLPPLECLGKLRQEMFLDADNSVASPVVVKRVIFADLISVIGESASHHP